jgi:hypothetical protein
VKRGVSAIVGQWFLTYKPCACDGEKQHRELHGGRFSEKDLGWQGQVLAEISPGLFLIQLYGWWDGAPQCKKVVSVADFVNDWQFFETDYCMRLASSSFRGISISEFEKNEEFSQRMAQLMNSKKK